MKIKSPVLKFQRVWNTKEYEYEILIEGHRLLCTYKHNGDDEDESNGWTYDLEPFEVLCEGPFDYDDLKEEIENILAEIDV
jgi:hypothetical protein